MADLDLKRGDTSPDFVYEIEEPGVSLVSATETVVIIVRDADGVKVYDRVPVAVLKAQWDADGGPELFVEVDTVLTGTVGTYRVEFEVTFADGEIQTFPRIGYKTIQVQQDLG